MAAVALASGIGWAAVPNSFSAGQPARASEVNRNFAYLDSAVGTKADQAAMGALQVAVAGLQATKADQSSVESMGKVLASKVDVPQWESGLKAKADTSAVRKLDDRMAAMVERSTVEALEEVVSKKADATWVTDQIAASAPTGVLAAVRNLSDLSDKAAARTNLGLGGLALKNSLGAADVGAIPSAAAVTFLKVESGNIVAYKDYTDGTKPKVPKLAMGDSQYGISSAGGVLELYSATGKVSLFQTAGLASAKLVGTLATQEWASGTFATQQWITGLFMPASFSSPSGEWRFSQTGSTGYSDPEPHVYRDAKFGGMGIATNGLHVNGNATVSGTINGKVVTGGILSENVADYVFEPDYRLAPLSEVEAFTKEHKHLPEVPSAKEIEAKGLDLAEMNLVLLKKVEELTLHAIEMEKRVRAMEGASREP